MKIGKTVLAIVVLCMYALAEDNVAVAPQQGATVAPVTSGVVSSTDAITIPQMLSYQGKLTDTLGVPVPDTLHAIRFRLYAQPTGGTQFWEENQNVRTTGGLFSVLLGSVTPIGSMPDAGAVYLGMAVGGGAELTPRLRIASAAYAYVSVRAANADLLQGKDTAALDSRYVNEGQANSVTSAMITNATIAAVDLGQMGASSGQVMKWTGSAWAPRNDSVGGGGVSDSVPGSFAVTTDLRVYGKGRIGPSNSNAGTAAFVAGSSNAASGNYSTAPGGYVDTTKALYGGVLSGYSNLAGDAVADTGACVAGGYDNAVTAKGAFVGGGRVNSVSGDYATVGGGLSDTASGAYSAIAGGSRNKAGGQYAFVGGGRKNTALSNYATVVGGDSNSAGSYGAVCGGLYNHAGSNAFVGGGYGSSAGGANAVVSGGGYNSASSTDCTVGGGEGNSASNMYATVAGGGDNQASGRAASIGGGTYNICSEVHTTVGGGRGNSASGLYGFGTIAGGDSNTASGSYSAIGGGRKNYAGNDYSTVAGGDGNSADGAYATVAGGCYDTVSASYGFAANNSSKVTHSNSAAFTGSHTTASNQVRAQSFSQGAAVYTMDHPSDPTNRILNQYGVGSPELVLMYRGSAVIGADGRAEVRLPDYFDKVNRNPMVQLTGVASTEVVYVAEKVSGNSFAIGGRPGTEVYWTVTGERKDQTAELARIFTPVEQAKTGELAGHSLDDDGLAGYMDQLEKLGLGGQFDFRTAAGRQRYEKMKQMTGGK